MLNKINHVFFRVWFKLHKCYTLMDTVQNEDAVFV